MISEDEFITNFSKTLQLYYEMIPKNRFFVFLKIEQENIKRNTGRPRLTLIKAATYIRKNTVTKL